MKAQTESAAVSLKLGGSCKAETKKTLNHCDIFTHFCVADFIGPCFVKELLFSRALVIKGYECSEGSRP